MASYAGPEEPLARPASVVDAERPAGQQQQSLWGFVRVIFASGDTLSEQATEQTAQELTDFFRTPIYLEKLLYFGFVLCLDSFLFIFTILPLRIFAALIKLVVSAVFRTGGTLTITQQCDILRGGVIVIVCFCLQQVDASKVYHLIRAQETIKLYVIFNVLEIFDKYCAWLGQDILDALFSRKRQTRVFLVAVAYTLVHSLVNFGQVMCLNVAINSYDHALLSMLVSNQFVELKGNVFKKFGKEQINKIACYDIVERFYQVVFLAIIFIRNMREVNFAWQYMEREIFLFTLVMASEILVDWVKHAFLSKFNGFNWSVYSEISLDLSNDVMYGHAIEALLTSEPRKRKFLDQSHLVTRKLGFVNLPLACLLVRILAQSVPRPSGIYGFSMVAAFWLCLTALKVLINVMVVGRAATTLQRQERKHLIGQLRQAQHELNIDISRRMHPMHEAGSSAWDSPLRSRNPSEISLSSMARRINADMVTSRKPSLIRGMPPPNTVPFFGVHGDGYRAGKLFDDLHPSDASDTSPFMSPGMTPITRAPPGKSRDELAQPPLNLFRSVSETRYHMLPALLENNHSQGTMPAPAFAKYVNADFYSDDGLDYLARSEVKKSTPQPTRFTKTRRRSSGVTPQSFEGFSKSLCVPSTTNNNINDHNDDDLATPCYPTNSIATQGTTIDADSASSSIFFSEDILPVQPASSDQPPEPPPQSLHVLTTQMAPRAADACVSTCPPAFGTTACKGTCPFAEDVALDADALVPDNRPLQQPGADNGTGKEGACTNLDQLSM